MNNGIPACWDPAEQEASRDRAEAQKLMFRPKCEYCGFPITGETYLDLTPFGIPGVACETCTSENTHYIEDLEDDYE